MVRKGYLIVLAGSSFASGYAYYKYVYKGESSPLLGKLISKYFITSPLLKFHADSASLHYTRSDGLSILFLNTAIKRDEEFGPFATYHDNYTRFDVTVDSLKLKVDLKRWLLEGRHPIVRCQVEGVRGTVDRSRLQYIPNWRMPYAKDEVSVDEGIVAKDVLVTLKNAPGTLPFPVSVYSADLPRLRWSWLLFDVLNAKSIVGSYDNSLFTYQPPQYMRKANSRHLRIDSLSIEHVNRGVVEGPLSWIQRGRMSVDIQVDLPECEYGKANTTLISDENLLKRFLKSANDAILTGFKRAIFPFDDDYSTDVYYDAKRRQQHEEISMSVLLKLTGVKAQLPLMASQVSLMSQALVRPTIAYLNDHRHHVIPLGFTFTLSVHDDLKGAWGLQESGIANLMAQGVADSFTKLTSDKERQAERMRKVGLWSVYSMFKQIITNSY